MPKDLKADPNAFIPLPTGKLGLRITGVKIREDGDKFHTVKIDCGKDGQPSATIWTTAGVFLSFENSITATEDDTVVCSIAGKEIGVDEQVNSEDKEVELKGLTTGGTIAYSCTKSPATGTPITESIGVRLVFDANAKPDFVTIGSAKIDDRAALKAATGQDILRDDFNRYGGQGPLESFRESYTQRVNDYTQQKQDASILNSRISTEESKLKATQAEADLRTKTALDEAGRRQQAIDARAAAADAASNPPPPAPPVYVNFVLPVGKTDVSSLKTGDTITLPDNSRYSISQINKDPSGAITAITAGNVIDGSHSYEIKDNKFIEIKPAQEPLSEPSTPDAKAVTQNFNIGVQGAQQNALATLGDTMRSFNEAAGSLTQAGLAVCNIAETMFTIHSQIAQALSQMEQFRICTDLQLNSIGTGACNGDSTDPQAAASAAQGCISNLVSCNNFMQNAGSTLTGMNEQLQTKSQQYDRLVGQGARLDFSFDVETDKGDKISRANEICSDDRVSFNVGPGTITNCGPSFDITYTKTIDQVLSIDNLRKYVADMKGQINTLEASANDLKIAQTDQQKADARRVVSLALNQLKNSATLIRNDASTPQPLKGSADSIVTQVVGLDSKIGNLDYLTLATGTSSMKSDIDTIDRGTTQSQLEQPRSLKQFFEFGNVAFQQRSAQSIFNIGQPADGTYRFTFNCPKLQGTSPTYTVNYRTKCNELPSRPKDPTDVTADIGKTPFLTPTEKLGLVIKGVTVKDDSDPTKVIDLLKEDSKYHPVDSDGTQIFVSWKTTGITVFVGNSMKPGDRVLCQLRSDPADFMDPINLKPSDTEIPITIKPNIAEGKLIYSCQKLDASGTRTDQAAEQPIKIKIDPKVAPDSLQLTSVEHKNNGAGKYSIISKFKITTKSRLKIEFIPESGQPIQLGETNLPTPGEYHQDSYTQPSVYYEVTQSTSPVLTGKVRITDLDRLTLTAEKSVAFTLTTGSTASTGGWKIDGKPISGSGVQEQDFVSVTLHDTVDPKTQKHTVTLNGQVTQGTPPTKVKIVYNDNVNNKDIIVEPQVTGGTFKWELAVVTDAAALKPSGVYKLEKLKISADGFTTVNLPRDLQLSAAPAAGGAEYADVDPNTKFKDIPAADVAAGKYKVVMADGVEKIVTLVVVNADGAALSHDEGTIAITDRGKGNEITIRQAILQNKLNGLKVKK